MKRRLPALLLALLLLGIVPTPARAEPDQAFVPVLTYEGQFTDVHASAWYYANVKALYELGLAKGQGGGGLFAPKADITVAEMIALTARLRSLYDYGQSEAGPSAYASSGAWYAPYVSYLKGAGVIGVELDGLCERPATRAQVAHLLANALPGELFGSPNGKLVSLAHRDYGYIPDVTESTPYQQDILRLYEWGILDGVDGTGSFRPEERIQRGQAAAMVTRLVYEDLRITLDWDLSKLERGTGMALLVESDGTFYEAPASTAEIDANIRRMLARGERRVVLRYPPNSLTSQAVDTLLEQHLNVIRLYVEQSYNAVSCASSIRTGSVTLTFSSSLYGDELLEEYRNATLRAATAVRDRLWANGTITAEMTEREKALAYFTWICENCAFDFNSTVNSMSHSGYSALIDGLAVCDGYTAAYNLFLKLEGITCSTVSTEDHIWTVAELDGTVCHIDTTWGDDRSGTIAYQYFGMTEAEAFSRAL